MSGSLTDEFGIIEIHTQDEKKFFQFKEFFITLNLKDDKFFQFKIENEEIEKTKEGENGALIHYEPGGKELSDIKIANNPAYYCFLYMPWWQIENQMTLIFLMDIYIYELNI